VLLVGHCLRFDPRYDQARQAVERGELGAIQTIYTRRANTLAAQDRLGGRCALPLFLGVQDYDVMRWLTGSDLPRVTAESKWGLLREQGFRVEDANCALLRFASGVLGIAELNWILPRGFPAAGDHRLDVVGSAGSLSIATLETGSVAPTPSARCRSTRRRRRWCRGIPAGCSTSSCGTSWTACGAGRRRPSRPTTP
jgi:predicted dehydrogenase